MIKAKRLVDVVRSCYNVYVKITLFCDRFACQKAKRSGRVKNLTKKEVLPKMGHTFSRSRVHLSAQPVLIVRLKFKFRLVAA